jgi:hypothetical protein
MLEELQLRNYADFTIEHYLDAVRSFAKFFSVVQPQFSFALRHSSRASILQVSMASIPLSLLPTSSAERLQFSDGQPGSCCAYVFGWALRLAYRLRNRAVAGCLLSSLQHSASSAQSQSMRLRARMCRLFFGLWARASVLLVRYYFAYSSNRADCSSARPFMIRFAKNPSI